MDLSFAMHFLQLDGNEGKSSSSSKDKRIAKWDVPLQSLNSWIVSVIFEGPMLTTINNVLIPVGRILGKEVLAPSITLLKSFLLNRW